MNNDPLTIEKIDNLNSLESIKNVWNALLENNDTKTVELTYEWQISYWKHFNQDAELFVLVIHKAGSIIAISPLKLTVRRVFGIKIRSLEIIGARTSNFQDLIIGGNSEDVLVCILDYLIKNQGSWDQLNLGNVPGVSITGCFFLEKLRNYPLLKLVENIKCVYLAIDNDRVDYKKSLGKTRTKQMKRTRLIERDLGKIRLRKSETADQLVSDLQLFINLHKKRWNPTDTPSQFMDSRYCYFYMEAGLQLLPKGQLGLSVLEAGNIPLALLIYFTFRQSIVLQLSAYDPDYSYYSPAIVLLDQLVDEALASGITEIDFGASYPYKASWTNQIKNRLNLLVFPKRFLPSAICAISKLYLALRSWLRGHPRILHIIKIISGRASIRKNLLARIKRVR